MLIRLSEEILWQTIFQNIYYLLQGAVDIAIPLLIDGLGSRHGCINYELEIRKLFHHGELGGIRGVFSH
jgi:hypothetical protein